MSLREAAERQAERLLADNKNRAWTPGLARPWAERPSPPSREKHRFLTYPRNSLDRPTRQAVGDTYMRSSSLFDRLKGACSVPPPRSQASKAQGGSSTAFPPGTAPRLGTGNARVRASQRSTRTFSSGSPQPHTPTRAVSRSSRNRSGDHFMRSVPKFIPGDTSSNIGGWMVSNEPGGGVGLPPLPGGRSPTRYQVFRGGGAALAALAAKDQAKKQAIIDEQERIKEIARQEAEQLKRERQEARKKEQQMAINSRLMA